MPLLDQVLLLCSLTILGYARHGEGAVPFVQVDLLRPDCSANATVEMLLGLQGIHALSEVESVGV